MSVLQERMKQKTFQNAGQEAMLNLIAASDHVRDRLNCLCQKKNISIAQYNILRILKGKFPQGYPRSEIASRMVERAPDITRIIDRMVSNGLVVRLKSEEDMRKSIAFITQKGINILVELNKLIHTYQINFQNQISKKQCENLTNICDSILRLD